MWLAHYTFLMNSIHPWSLHTSHSRGASVPWVYWPNWRPRLTVPDRTHDHHGLGTQWVHAIWTVRDISIKGSESRLKYSVWVLFTEKQGCPRRIGMELDQPELKRKSFCWLYRVLTCVRWPVYCRRTCIARLCSLLFECRGLKSYTDHNFCFLRIITHKILGSSCCTISSWLSTSSSARGTSCEDYKSIHLDQWCTIHRVLTTISMPLQSKFGLLSDSTCTLTVALSFTSSNRLPPFFLPESPQLDLNTHGDLPFLGLRSWNDLSFFLLFR